MIAARNVERDPLQGRLLVIDPIAGRFEDARADALLSFLSAGDLLVVNDAATLPASFLGRTASGRAVELRLLGPSRGRQWHAALLGEGDWRTPTERRPSPELLEEGAVVQLGAGLRATVRAHAAATPRLLSLELELEAGGDEDALWSAIYAAGRPVQYSYLGQEVPLGSVQTAFAGRPWASEMPSAARPIRSSTLVAARARGIEVAALTHAAGLSSIGDAELDALLPLPERFEIPPSTAGRIRATRARGGRVLAAGTTVVRALEGAALLAGAGETLAQSGETGLVLGPGFVPRVVDGVLSGIHEPSASHFALLCAFAPRALLLDAHAHAERSGYLGHEFGDSCLILPGKR